MIYPLMAVIFCLVCGFQIYSTYLTWVHKGEVADLLAAAESTQQTIAQSQTLEPDLRDGFTRIFISLIPASEDAFALGDAVANLISQTNMKIDRFTPPNPSDIKGANNQISILISGKSTDFDRFLQMYKYVSGRFITMDSCTVTYDKTGVSADLKLTFHTAPVPKGTDQLTSFTTELRKKLVSIQDQLPADTTLIAPEENVVIDTNYDTKAPF
jgi:hypothetical protein